MAPRQRKQENNDAGGASKAKDHAKKFAENPKQQQQDSPRSPVLWRKIVGRFIISALMIFAVYFTSNKNSEIVLASQKDTIKHRTHDVPCSKNYEKEVKKFKGCFPQQCGRVVSDIIVSSEEAGHLLQIAKKGLAFGGSSGGASILDLHSGALSQGSSFINIYEKLKAHGKDKVFSDQDFRMYRNVRHKVQQLIAYNFGIEVNKLHLTHPTFFSEMTPISAKTVHDEYWHVHVDKETYPSFHYTSLLYLTDYGNEFTGGRFVFVDKVMNMTIEPKLGRVSAFTSGAENPHFVERVSGGRRYALTISFTCDKTHAIADPSISKLK